MNGWETKTIAGLGRVVTGKTPPTDNRDYYGGEELFVSPKDLARDSYYVFDTETKITAKALQKFKNQVLPQDAVLFTSLSFAFGKMAIASRSLLTNQQINSVVVNSDNVPKFVYYLLRTYEPIIFSYNSGIDTPIVPKSVFESIKVVVPTKHEQEKIAAVLSAYDDLIENNRRRIALLERMAEQLYREWFVRFRFPGHERVEFEKGVPVAWDTDYASRFFGYVRGKSYTSEELSDDPSHAPFITLKSFNRGGGYRADGLKRFSGRHKAEQIARLNDVVMAVTDMTQGREVIGRVARVPDFGVAGAVISMDVIKLVPKTISPSFLYSYMRLSGFGEYIKEFANGTNVLHLKPELVTRQRVTMPPNDLRDKFSAIVEPVFEQIDLLTRACDSLGASRNLLLPRLISGKLRVDQLNIQFPPSMQDAA